MRVEGGERDDGGMKEKAVERDLPFSFFFLFALNKAAGVCVSVDARGCTRPHNCNSCEVKKRSLLNRRLLCERARVSPRQLRFFCAFFFRKKRVLVFSAFSLPPP